MIKIVENIQAIDCDKRLPIEVKEGKKEKIIVIFEYLIKILDPYVSP